MESNFCYLPWSWLDVNLQTGQIRSCCKTNWMENTNLMYFQNEEIKKRRIIFLKNSRPTECSVCWTAEDRGQDSYRLHTQKLIACQTDDLEIDADTPVTIGIRLESLCNMACSYCGPHYSSMWAAEKNIKVTPIINNDFKSNFLDWFSARVNNEKIKRIILLGGEPTITPSYYEILDFIINKVDRKTKLRIVTQTNGMFSDIHKQKIYEYSKSKNIILNFSVSIDAIEERAEFIRTGLKWNKFLDNFNFLYSLSRENFLVDIHPTLSLFNLGGYGEFFNWIDNYPNLYGNFGFNILEHPKEMALSTIGQYSLILPPKLSEYKNININLYLKKIDNYIQKFTNIPSVTDLADIYNFCLKNELRSGLDLKHAVPDVYNMLERYYVR